MRVAHTYIIWIRGRSRGPATAVPVRVPLFVMGTSREHHLDDSFCTKQSLFP